MTSGRGLIVSKFPLGICKIKLIVLGTDVTILDPRSTRRFSNSGSATLSSASPDLVRMDDNVIKGAKCASWAVVAKITNPEAMQNEFTLDANKRVTEVLAMYSLPEFDKPARSVVHVEPSTPGVGGAAAHEELKQNSGNEATCDVCLSRNPTGMCDVSTFLLHGIVKQHLAFEYLSVRCLPKYYSIRCN